MKKNIGGDLKIIIVGNSGTGKTSFVNRWTKNSFSETYKATIVSEFGYKILNVDDVIYKIQLWDLAGQDKNTCITKIFCKDAHGALIVADCTDKHSLIETAKWKTSIDDNSKFIDGFLLPAVLIENKCDLLTDLNDSTQEELKEYSRKNNFINSFRTSAKEGVNVKESIEFLIKEIIKRLSNVKPEDLKRTNQSKTSDSIKLVKNKDASETLSADATANRCCN